MDFVFHDAPLETIFPIVFYRLIITEKNGGICDEFLSRKPRGEAPSGKARLRWRYSGDIRKGPPSRGKPLVYMLDDDLQYDSGMIMKHSQEPFTQLVREGKDALTMGDFNSHSRSVLAGLR